MDELTPIEISNLEVFGNPCELRRDLHVFVNYVQEREVKRLHRSNNLSKPDALRLAKLMSDPEAEAEVREHGESAWVDFIDWLALTLGFVSYDTQGTYAGYTSTEPSFPDNYILPNIGKYQSFLESSLADQERLFLDTLIGWGKGGGSEFFSTGVLGRLDHFSSRGCATGVVPTLDFPEVRRFLLNLLQVCQNGVWYTTESLIQYLKTNHPFFLIPKTPKYRERWGRSKGRYDNFRESKDYWGDEIEISEDEPNAFERVEGRYVERFLESAPLTLGYVDVAYDTRPHKGVYPSINKLKAFRVSSRLQRVLEGDIPPPKVTVLPTFEIYVESEFYPAGVLAQLTPLTDLVSEDVLTVMKLQKEKVAAHLAQDENLDVVSLLIRLFGRDLPQNVARELAEWTDHAEKFTLYEGFVLLEGDEDLPVADPFTAERISPTLRIVHSPDTLFVRMERQERIPLRVKHTASSLRVLPRQARSVFPKKSRAARPRRPKKASVTLKRQTTITLHFPNGTVLEKFRKALLDVRCPVEADKDNLTITFFRKYETEVAKTIKALGKNYRIQIEDIE